MTKGKINRNGARYIAREYIHSLIHLAALFLSAGTVRWTNAWLCMGLGAVYQTINLAVLYRMNPELINKRGTLVGEGTKSFDKVFIALYIPIGLSASIVAGLDAVRYRWSSMPIGYVIAGVAIYVAACAFGTWAMAVNAHFETTVVVGGDEHTICDRGPYKIVRHPGYAAAIVGSVSYAMILGSLWALLPVAALIILFIVRTALEDRTLRNELKGYEEFAARTRYRLLPLIW